MTIADSYKGSVNQYDAREYCSIVTKLYHVNLSY